MHENNMKESLPENTNNIIGLALQLFLDPRRLWLSICLMMTTNPSCFLDKTSILSSSILLCVPLLSLEQIIDVKGIAFNSQTIESKMMFPRTLLTILFLPPCTFHMFLPGGGCLHEMCKRGLLSCLSNKPFHPLIGLIVCRKMVTALIRSSSD